mmetsp:Transcript_2666/g.10251  ORF Transcript_2666/g.10251 Transcript_2666/m.10251 type:complete len:116 (+) Transcript_2666:1350-1697(+)
MLFHGHHCSLLHHSQERSSVVDETAKNPKKQRILTFPFHHLSRVWRALSRNTTTAAHWPPTHQPEFSFPSPLLIKCIRAFSSLSHFPFSSIPAISLKLKLIVPIQSFVRTTLFHH